MDLVACLCQDWMWSRRSRGPSSARRAGAERTQPPHSSLPLRNQPQTGRWKSHALRGASALCCAAAFCTVRSTVCEWVGMTGHGPVWEAICAKEHERLNESPCLVSATVVLAWPQRRREKAPGAGCLRRLHWLQLGVSLGDPSPFRGTRRRTRPNTKAFRAGRRGGRRRDSASVVAAQKMLRIKCGDVAGMPVVGYRTPPPRHSVVRSWVTIASPARQKAMSTTSFAAWLHVPGQSRY
jgi:hypothetical protein